MKKALYPCCATDFDEPLRILQSHADEVVFCDPDPSVKAEFELRVFPNRPSARLCSSPILEALPRLGRVDVLFYRRDSGGEGGSGVFVLGDGFMRRFLPQMSDTGLIIADGSGERGGLFRKMNRKSGFERYGMRLRPSERQPYSDLGLRVIEVRRQFEP